MHEKRREERIPLSRPIHIDINGSHTVRARGVDLSYHGIGVLCPYNLPVGLAVTLRFQTGVNALQQEVNARATVRHSHLRSNQFFIGFVFAEQNERGMQLIHELVDHKLMIRRAQGL